MSKPKSDGLTRRGFLGFSLGAVTVATIGCGSDHGAESSMDLGSGGSGGNPERKGSGGAATGGSSPASGGAASPTATASTGGTSEAHGSQPVTGGTPGNLGNGGSQASVQEANGGSLAQVGGNAASSMDSGGSASTARAASGGQTTGGASPSSAGAASGGLTTGGASPSTAGAASGGLTTGGASPSTAGAPTTGSTPAQGGAKVQLAAACGTFCGACPAYIATHPEDDQIPYSNPWGNCDGCLGGARLAPHCKACSIRLCALNNQQGARCTNCETLPCNRVTKLINAGNYLHRKEYLPNLEKMRQMGVEEWLKYEEERWRCPKCRLPMSWYDTECVRCKEPRSANLFPVTKDTPRPY